MLGEFLEGEEMEFREVSKKCYKKQTSKFIRILYEILNNSSLSNIVSWDENGRRFSILNQGLFADEVLSKYYKNSNYSTFVRQLSLYGFSKNKNSFSNARFLKGRPELLVQIFRQRKKAMTETEAVSSSSDCRDMSSGCLAEIVLSEVRQLQQQQRELEVGIQMMQYHSQLQDYSFQLALNKSYRKAQSEKIGGIVLVILSKYQNGSETNLDLDSVKRINEIMHSWVGDSAHRVSDIKKCFIVYKFFSAYEFACHTLTEKRKSILNTASQKFLDWIQKFTFKNGIYFPHIGNLFLRLIYCIVPLPGDVESFSGESGYARSLRDRLLGVCSGLSASKKTTEAMGEEKELTMLESILHDQFNN